MQQIVVLAIVVAVAAAVFVFGWFLMKRVDCFLEEKQQDRELEYLSGDTTLRLGFSNPHVLHSIANILEGYASKYSDISIRVFFGAEGKLLKELAAHQVDMIFLPENVAIPSDIGYNIKKILLRYQPVVMKYGGLPVEPIANGDIVQYMLYLKESEDLFVNDFAEYIEGELVTSEP